MSYLTCLDATTPNFLFFNTLIAPPLLFYSYIPIVILLLFISTFVLIKDKYSLQSKLLFLISILFSTLVLNELNTWLAVPVKILYFSWQIVIPVEILLYISFIYFHYVYLNKKDINFKYKIFLGLVFLPVLILLPTHFNISSFDISGCNGTYGPLLNYNYIFQIATIVTLFFVSFDKYWSLPKGDVFKKEVILMTSGVLVFLINYSLLSLYGELTLFYNINLIGPVGMLLFLGFMSYMIVRYHTFHIRLFGAQALVVGLIALIASKLFTAEAGASRIITIVTLCFVSLFGYFLIKSVKKEIETREKIEKLADQLELANERLHILDQQKSQFVSLASHQLRAPLTAIKGYLSMIMEGDYGEVKGEIREMIQRVFDSANNLVTIVGDFLDVSRIEQGKMVYDWKDFDLRPLVETVGHELRQMADKRGLEFVVSIQEGQTYMVHGDMGKLKQVFTNLTDNSIKYTPKGKVWIELSRPTPDTVRFEVNDNGIGIAPETLPKLFEKFTRAEGANDVNVIGTGLGLYVAKEMIRAHEGGKIWAESDGKGLGSTFVVELQAL